MYLFTEILLIFSSDFNLSCFLIRFSYSDFCRSWSANLFFTTNSGIKPYKLSTAVLKVASSNFLETLILVDIFPQMSLRSVESCSLFSGEMSFLINGSTAALNFPCLMTSTPIPYFAAKSFRNVTSVDNPFNSTIPTGFRYSLSATEAR